MRYDKDAHLRAGLETALALPAVLLFPCGLLFAALIPAQITLLLAVLCAAAFCSFLFCRGKARWWSPHVLFAFLGLAYGILRFSLFPKVPEIGSLFPDLFDGIRTSYAAILTERVGGQEGALLCAMLLGVRDGLTHGVTAAFSRLGISHILAISGLHLSVLSGSLYGLVRLFGVRRQFACLAGAAFSLLFCALCGFPYSLTRAMLMQVLYFICILCGRDGNAIHSLSLAGAVICLFSPSAVTALSFQMSFCATAGILCLADKTLRGFTDGVRCRRWRAVLTYLGGMVVTTFCANLFLLPIYALETDGIAPAGFMVNLLFLPLAALLLYIAPFVILLSPIPIVSDLAAAITRAVASVFLRCAARLDAAVGIILPASGLPAFLFLAALLCGTGYWYLKKLPAWGYMLFSCGIFLLFVLCGVFLTEGGI